MNYRLFFDVTELATFDKGTGIQRVTRSLLLALSRLAPSDWEVIPVRGNAKTGRYLTAPSINIGSKSPKEAQIEPRAGDIFLSVDLTYNITPSLRNELIGFRNSGVGIYFVVYDLIPLMYPEWFEGTNDWFEGNDYLKLFSYWFDCVSEEADGLLCISEAVRKDVESWFAQHKLKRQTPPSLSYFHLGSDINLSVPTTGLPADAQDIIGYLGATTSFLMVGTLEPRKGHELALNAIEGLWAQGKDVNLVFVGRAGWKISHLIERIKSHPRFGTNLFWLDGISDEYLQKVYANCSALLALSVAEGFGLPLIEAAYFHLPRIVRDIPVFREVCGTEATYFTGTSSAELLALLEDWIQSYTGNETTYNKIQTWEESAMQLITAIGKMRGNERFWRTNS